MSYVCESGSSARNVGPFRPCFFRTFVSSSNFIWHQSTRSKNGNGRRRQCKVSNIYIVNQLQAKWFSQNQVFGCICHLYAHIMIFMLERDFTSISICGEVVAGLPARSEEIEPECIAVDLSTIGISPTARMFALRVRGNSMIGAHILDGDTVVLELKPAHDGAVVAALVDGESTLKRYFMRRGIPFLRAEHPKYPDIIPARELVIQGVVVAVFRKT